MWNYFMHRNTRNGEPNSTTNSGTPAKRRRRIPFAGAEPLESRALLSATGNDAPMGSVSAIELANNLPPVPADIALFGGESSKSPVDSSDAQQSDEVGPKFVNRFGGAASLPGFSDEMFASIAQSTRIQDASAGTNSGSDSIFARSLFDNSEQRVELRVAETGQLVSVGSASSVQDSNGLTISDDGSPTTYLRTIDAEGRVYSQLAFVTRTSRRVPISESQTPINFNSAVVAESDLSNESISDELAARPDLHDLETALDAASQPTSSNSQHENSSLSLAAASRSRWVTSLRVAGTKRRELRAVTDTHHHAAAERMTSLDAQNDEFDDTDFDESSAMPVFDPTTRNVVVSVCLLGSLARATARRRRRMKAALAR